MERTNPEPWLRGNIVGTDPVIAQVLYSFQQTLEDLDYFTDGLTDDQIWLSPENLASVGFHIRHIAGSIERLLTYAEGGQLTPAQMADLRAEAQPGPGRDPLMNELRTRFGQFEPQIRRINPESFNDARKVGRKELPTTVGGLLVHIAEHTQRHVGQAIIMAKLARQSKSGG